MITWLASYPRSGNTFLRIILNKVFGIQTYSVYNDLKDIEPHKQTKDIVGHLLLPKEFSFENARQSEQEYFIKTHRHPIDKTDKAIYLIRDGRYCIASYYYYRNVYNMAPPLIDFIEGRIRIGSWSEHIEKWMSIDEGKLLLIMFDDLISNQLEVIEKISDFINMKPNDIALPGFKDLNKINPEFFNAGVNRTYKDLFSEQDHLFFWERHHKQMINYNFTSDVPEVYRKMYTNF